jgi:hypothetical protein
MSKMTPNKRAVAVTGTYTDRNGSEKKRYTTIGTLFRYDDGNLSLKIDAVPVGQGWNGFVSFYDLEERKTGAETSTREPGQDLNDEIPF